MKVLVYGASVTAQKDEGGFYQHLKNQSGFDLLRIPFGASHLQFAGLAMLSKVLAEKPDVCLLDWVTPSTKSFPSGIVERINRILIQHNIFPIWVLFPRTDDPYCSRECCEQISEHASKDVWVRDFTDTDFGKGVELTTILRDVVHTNKVGAHLYASFIEHLLVEYYEREFKQQSLTTIGCQGIAETVPCLINNNIKIGRASSYKLELTVTETCDLNIFIFCQIGPASPMLNIQLKNIQAIIFNGQRNVVDAWCYYKRDMLINLPTIRTVVPGVYELEISVSDAEPFENINTLKPINDDDMVTISDRFLNMYEIAIDGNVSLERKNEL
jgi:hypothetical protein